MTREERTASILKRVRDRAGEWDALFSWICGPCGWTSEDRLRLSELIDPSLIAQRIDELRCAHTIGASHDPS
jgi:hypothetical protein